jgi:hypothetical protein
MPTKTVLRNRIPEIMATLQPRTEEGLKVAAEAVAERAREKAPVLTGRLRDSIHVEEVDNGYSVVADAEDDQGRPYAVYVEYGGHTGPGAIGAPHAFMTPAMEESRDLVPEYVNLALRSL